MTNIGEYTIMNTDTTQDQANQQDPDKSQDASQDTTDVQSLVDKAVEVALKKSTEAINGLNRTVSAITNEKNELANQLKTSELDKLTEKDRAAEELQIARDEKTKIESETVLLKRERLVDKTLVDAGLPIEFAKRINGEDETAILEDVTALSAYLNQHIKDGIDKGISERLSGKGPESGKTLDPGNIDTQIKTAQDAGNWALVMQLRGQKEKLTE